ncbi:MAG: hypothetical protein F6K09_08195 [Merismopedia sp. SIO2A8]|nr:hypothetical protein [Symploca sp. SIO2B6]NET48692.1 hypothetical protein [Merismopedia sp. SIO2A8]
MSFFDCMACQLILMLGSFGIFTDAIYCLPTFFVTTIGVYPIPRLMKRNLILGLLATFCVILLTTAISVLSPLDPAPVATAQGSSDEAQKLATQPVDGFNDYWNQGLAEITSYKLEQARYGETHEGNAVLVFVTEPFSAQKQVKLDYPQQAGSDNVPILKLNMTKKFNTGVYPYSMMLSTFTPRDMEQYPHTLKVTATSQEWCGHTFMQLNNREQDYDVAVRSYFEEEGDDDFSLEKTWIEDELWSRIRINPDSLPTGNVAMVPSFFYTRLRHTPFEVMEAIATLADDETNPGLKTYTLNYPSQSRTLTIHFESTFPYAIQGWEETHLSGFGNPKMLTTKATAINHIMSDYWRRHRNIDTALREELGLPL